LSLKEFLKPTKGKIILFAIFLIIYVSFWLFPGYLLYLKYIGQGFPFEERNIIEQYITIIAEIAGIYLLSCALIAVKNKIKK